MIAGKGVTVRSFHAAAALASAIQAAGDQLRQVVAVTVAAFMNED
jgi:hypothetical protein